MVLGSLLGHWPRCKTSTANSGRRCGSYGWSEAGSQDVLSDRSGLHRAHIGEIERGETNVTLQTLKTLADTLSVRITDLVKGL